MLQLPTRTRPSLIAVDFGTCSLRAVQLVRSGANWRVYHWMNVEADLVSAEPPPMDHAAHLQMGFGPGAFHGRRAAVSLASPEVEYRLVDIPSALLERKPTELKEALQFELDRQLPWPVAESEIAAWPVLPPTNNLTSTMIVAARAGAVQRFLDLLGSQQLECCRADIAPNALARAMPALAARGPAADRQVWGVLDLGFRASRLYLMFDNQPVYARVLRGGGRELTETLARTLRLEFHVAEQYKRLYGIQLTDRGVRSMAGGLGRISEDALPGVLYAILAKTLDTLAAEIERSYRFALGRHVGSTTGPLYLAGGGARLRGLPEVLSSKLGTEVRLPDPGAVFHGAGTSAHPACSAANYPVLAMSVGLAMAEEAA